MTNFTKPPACGTRIRRSLFMRENITFEMQSIIRNDAVFHDREQFSQKKKLNTLYIETLCTVCRRNGLDGKRVLKRHEN